MKVGEILYIILTKLKRLTTGAEFDPSTDCIDLHNGNLTAFRTIQACNGMESSLLECGGIQPCGFGEPCLCNAVAKIMCQKAGKRGLYAIRIYNRTV